MVLRLGHTSKLFPLRPLRSELAIPLVLQARTYLGCRLSRPPILYPHLGALPLVIRPSLEISHLDTTSLRHWPRCAKVVSDALGYVEYGTMGSVGWYPAGRGAGRTSVMALAWRAGRSPRCRHRHDTIANSDTVSRHLHAGVCAGGRQYSYHCGQG